MAEDIFTIVNLIVVCNLPCKQILFKLIPANDLLSHVKGSSTLVCEKDSSTSKITKWNLKLMRDGTLITKNAVFMSAMLKVDNLFYCHVFILKDHNLNAGVHDICISMLLVFVMLLN